MKTSTQLKALIRNLSKEKSIEAEIILRNYMLVSVKKLFNKALITGYPAKLD